MSVNYSKNALLEFSKTHIIWDPAILNDDGRYYLYVLATDKDVTQENFFITENHIHGFVSNDLLSWEDLGVILNKRNENDILYAGSVFKENGIFYFFYSVLTTHISEYLLDQRVYLATSEDGINYKFNNSFSLEPDKLIYETKVKNPQTGEMMFAWRDPCIFKDPQSAKYYLFISAGGFRWNIPAQLAVAVADKIAGPYTLLPPVIDGAKDSIPVSEFERVFVEFRDKKYYIFTSGWKCNTTQKCIDLCKKLGHEVTNSTVYVFSADHILGPYISDEDSPVVRCSEKVHFYGAMAVPSVKKDEPPFVIGWLPEGRFNVEVSDRYHLCWSGMDFYLREDR